MAQFPALELTSKGQDMIIRASSNKESDRLIITKAKLGDGILNKGIESMEDIISTKLEVPLSDIKLNNNQATMYFIYDNKALNEGFYHREVGVFAKNGTDGKEYLLSYSNAGSYTSYIPAKDIPIPGQTLQIVIGVGNTDNVELTISDDGLVTPRQLEEFKLKLIELLNEHREMEVLDHPERSIKEKHLAEASVKRLQLADDSVYGSAIKNKAITPEKLDKEYVEITRKDEECRVIKGLTFTSELHFNNTLHLSKDKITDNSDNVINSAWANANLVKTIDGKKGNVDFNSMLYKISNETAMKGKTMEEYFQKLGWVKNYYNSETCKANNLPYNDSTILSFPAFRADHSYMQLLFSRYGMAFREWMHGVAHENAPWGKMVLDTTIDEVLLIKNYDLRNKTSAELANLGFRKLRGGAEAANLGYPTNWCLVLNIPAIVPGYVDVHQLAFGNDSDLYVRNIYNNANTNDVPWQKCATVGYVDDAMRNSTSIEILDYEI